MIRTKPFPISIEELDAATLTTALGRAVASYTAERIGADRGMLGEIFLVRPEYADGASGPTPVICKFAALREGALASALRGRTHERELRCYDELLAGTNVSTPQFHGAWYDADTSHFLLVQGAVDADHDVDQVAGIDPSLIGRVVSEAATLHSERWDDATLASLTWLPRLDDPGRIHNLTALATNGWGPLCDLLGDDLSASERALGDAFPERLERAFHELAAMPSTLIHGDLRADNLLFSRDHTVVSLIDWQGAGFGPGSFDIAYLLSHSLTIEDRRHHAAALIDHYLSELSASGVEHSHDDFMAGFRRSLHFGLAVACALPLIGDPRQPRVKRLAGAMARRSIAALRDYDQLW